MLVLILIGVAYILWTFTKRNRYKDEPPLLSDSKILLGHALLYIGSSTRFWSNITKACKECMERGGVLKTTAGPKTIYFVTDPEACSTVSNICLQKESIYEFAKPWLGDGLVTSSPAVWKVHRKLLTPSFSPNVVDSFIDVFNSKSRCLVSNLKAEIGRGLFDHLKYAKVHSLETVFLTALGVDISEKNATNTEFVTALETMLNVIISRFQTFWLHSNFVYNLSSLKKTQDHCIKILHNMSNTILRNRKQSFLNSISYVENMKDKPKGSKFKPFMELLLELSHDTNAFTDRGIREHVDTVIVAGHDTLANALTFCMMFVAANPQVQEKIYEELKNIFGDEDRDVTKQDLLDLVYLEAVVKESMRLYPPVPFVGRYLTEDVKLENCTLYKGNSVFMSIYSIHRHSVWGPDAEEFKPERWLDPSTLPENPNASVGFGLGRRNCLGKSYTMKAMKITMAHICRNYIMHGEPSNLTLKLDVFLQPISGYYIASITEIGNCTLYKGNSVFMSIYSIHRHHVWGPDAEVFKPERWLDPSTLPENQNASVGFGLGRRNCIGKAYAIKAMKTTMVHICRNYVMHGEHSNLKLKLDVFLQPVSGYYVKIERRN